MSNEKPTVEELTQYAQQLQGDLANADQLNGQHQRQNAVLRSQNEQLQQGLAAARERIAELEKGPAKETKKPAPKRNPRGGQK